MNWRIEYTPFLYREKELISIGEFSNNSMRHPDITSTTSTTTMSIIARIRDVTPQQTAEAIKNIAKNIWKHHTRCERQ
jgi:hypothetical protein